MALGHTASPPASMNADWHQTYPQAIDELKGSGELTDVAAAVQWLFSITCSSRIIVLKKERIAASLWFRSVDGTVRTIAGHER